jgi:precorrin-2 methylase
MQRENSRMRPMDASKMDCHIRMKLKRLYATVHLCMNSSKDLERALCVKAAAWNERRIVPSDVS